MNHRFFRSLTFCFLLSSFLSVFCFASADEQYAVEQFTENRIFLLNQPRSGTHWMTYIMRHFTKRPFLNHGQQTNRFLDQDDDFSVPYICLYHHAGIFLKRTSPAPNFEKDKVVLIIRNPLDTLLRDSTSLQDALMRIRRRFQISLFYNLKYSEKCLNANRYICYYEDLLDNPRAEISKLLKFLEVSDDGLDEFIANLEHHQNHVLAHYPVSKTKGKDRTLYQRKYTAEQLQTFVSLLKEIDPVIWDKYLTRYEF